MDLETLLAGGGVSGGVIAVVLLLYRIFGSKKSKCHTEIGGVILDVNTAPGEPEKNTVITVDNPIKHERHISSSEDAQ